MTAANVLLWTMTAFDVVGIAVGFVLSVREARELSAAPEARRFEEDGRVVGRHGRHCACCLPTERIAWDARGETLAAVLAGLYKL